MQNTPTASDILDIASKLVSGDRAVQHGDKMVNFRNTARMWEAHLWDKLKPGERITPEDAAMMMVLFKIARTKSGTYNPDDYIDGAGYLGIAGEIAAATQQE